jgi:hypothetical protein
MARQYIGAMQCYGYGDVQRILLLLNDANLKSLGVNRADTDDESILKEFIFKIMHPY